jgi:hypothetical protein
MARDAALGLPGPEAAKLCRRRAALAWLTRMRHETERTETAKPTPGRCSAVATVDYKHGFPWG